ncbi:hypothetical protein TWF696_005555 [Orbilia brochopaga]|uniref:NADP-dependent oxidoreductase domain-containing protein n=1 Tax=Orbilia brochopaga TaxID=3140254 RepID=A0AAV9V4E2_9PEZI
MASLRAAKIFDKTTKVTLRGLKHNVEVPAMACGTWSWGDSRNWGYKEDRDLPGIKEVWGLLNNERLGFYDGAEVYGPMENERILGRLLKDTPADLKSDVVIATKWVPSPVFFGRLLPGRGIVGALRNSLARLGVEQVDLYQVHIPIFWFYSIETMAKGLAECVNLGLTKTVGVSNFNKEQMIQMHDALAKYGVPLASNQIEFNLLRRIPESSGLLAACHERNIVPLAYSPLAMGRLTGKYSSKNPPPSNRMYGNQPWEIVDPLLEAMKDIGDKRGVPISAIALNWVMCKGCIPLGGARNLNQAAQNIKALGFRLTDEEVARLDGLAVDGTTLRYVQAG